MISHIEYPPWRLHLNLWRFSYFAWRIRHPAWRLARLARSLRKAEGAILSRAQACTNPQQRALFEKVAMFYKLIWEDLQVFVEIRDVFLENLRHLKITTNQVYWDQAKNTFRDCQKQLDDILAWVVAIDALLTEARLS